MLTILKQPLLLTLRLHNLLQLGKIRLQLLDLIFVELDSFGGSLNNPNALASHSHTYTSSPTTNNLDTINKGYLYLTFST